MVWPMSDANQTVTVRFTDGYSHSWPIPAHDSAEGTLEQMRQLIERSLWFQVPGTSKYYSAQAIVSVEIGTAAAS
jgi:hypothetical protein